MAYKMRFMKIYRYINYKISKSLSKRKIKFFIYVATLVLLCILAVIIFRNPVENTELPSIVMRVDDIQDYAFKEAQIFLLDESINRKIPFSLAVISNMFGKDLEIVNKVILAIASGSEVSVH